MRFRAILNGEGWNGPVSAPDDAIAAAPVSAPAETPPSPSAASPESAAPEQPAASPEVPASADSGSSTAAPVEPIAPAEAAKTDEFPPTLMESAEKPAEPKAEDKPEAKKDGEAAKPEAPPEAPPTYAFQWPDDVKSEQVDQERMGAFTELLGTDRVKPENAQKLLDMHIAEVRSVADRVEKAVAERQWNVFRDQQNNWKEEVMADPVLGGSRFQTAMKTCATVIEQYGGSKEDVKALWDDLRATGMGNSPRLLRLFHRLGESFGREATMVPASPARSAQLSGRERGMARYNGQTR